MFLSSWGCWRKEYAYAENRFHMWWDPFHYHLSLMVSFYFGSQNGANNLDWQPRHIKEAIWFHKNNCAPSPACKIVQTFNLFIATHFVFWLLHTKTKKTNKTKNTQPFNNFTVFLFVRNESFCLPDVYSNRFLICEMLIAFILAWFLCNKVI